MIPLETGLCPWKLSKQITDLEGNTDTCFKWVHPWRSVLYKESTRRYIIVKWHHASNRKSYPAYTMSELFSLISDVSFSFRFHNYRGYYCMNELDRERAIVYCSTPIEACAHYYILLLKEIKEDKKEEAIIKQEGLR